MTHLQTHGLQLAIVATLLGTSGCASWGTGSWRDAPNATVRAITTLAGLPAGIDRHCVDSRTLPPDAPVAVVTYRVARMPQRVAIPLHAAGDVESGRRYLLRPGSCQLGID